MSAYRSFTRMALVPYVESLMKIYSILVLLLGAREMGPTVGSKTDLMALYGGSLQYYKPDEKRAVNLCCCK